MRISPFFTAMFFASLPLLASAIEADAVIDASKPGETGSGKGRVPYRLYSPPAGGGALPLVVCLHGAGGRGSDNTTQITDTWWAPNVLVSPEHQEAHPCFVLLPQCGSGRRWVDLEWKNGVYETALQPETPELASVAALVRKFAAKPEIDASRIYITGMSMGGYGTWDLLARHPELFAAAVPICGAGDASAAPKYAHVPIWAFHGADDPVVPASGSREVVAALKEAGSSVKYTEFPGMKHNSWQPAWKETKLVPWLFSQSKN